MLLQSPDENWHQQLPLLRNPHVPDAVLFHQNTDGSWRDQRRLNAKQHTKLSRLQVPNAIPVHQNDNVDRPASNG